MIIAIQKLFVFWLEMDIFISCYISIELDFYDVLHQKCACVIVFCVCVRAFFFCVSL